MASRNFISKIDDWTGEGLLSIIGPTGSGKTALALECVRKNFTTDLKHPLLVSVDSIAAYSELNIGSAKPSVEEIQQFRWSGIDLFTPTEEVNARRFIEAVGPLIASAISQRRPIILVGGSFFYERALVDGMSPGDKSDPDYIAGLSKKSNDDLHSELMTLDPRWGDKVHPNDRYRLERFSDLALRQRLGFDQLFEEKKAGPLDSLAGLNIKTLVHGMDWDRDQYLIRLQDRIRQMMASGWLDEVKNLIEKYSFEKAPALSSVGYLQIVRGLRSGRTPLQIEDDVLVSHLQLVKKQKTWIRGMNAKK